jgi:pimeloyl-ACP methyl ester carboxylesterase
MANSLPLLLLSGMATDERLFEPQRLAFPNLRVPAWIEPLPRESLRSYAARLARVIDPGCPCIVGGASFGGTVALEMAPHLQAVACVLISSLRSSAELPWSWRICRPLADLGPEWLGVLAGLTARLGAPCLPRGAVRRMQRLSGPQAAFVRWAMCAVVRWRPSLATRRVRVFQIHGENDHTLPVQRTRPDVIVPGGSHALPLFNPVAVNEFLGWVIEWATRLEGGKRGPD